jgi:hypothetical protein
VATDEGSPEFVRALSAALREHDPLEPWLTESHFDDHYWDDIASAVAKAVAAAPGRSGVAQALRSAQREEFGEPDSTNRFFRQKLEERIDRFAAAVTN